MFVLSRLMFHYIRNTSKSFNGHVLLVHQRRRHPLVIVGFFEFILSTKQSIKISADISSSVNIHNAVV